LSELRESDEREWHRYRSRVINWGEGDHTAKPRDDVQAILIERGALGGGGKWLKYLLDDGSEERFNKWTMGIEERLKFIEILDLIDTLSTETGENWGVAWKRLGKEGRGSELGAPSNTSYSTRMARAA
jgi:hypothetical protein